MHKGKADAAVPLGGEAAQTASRSRASGSPLPGDGEGGWISDEIDNLVEPTERPSMDGRAGSTSHGWRGVRPERPGQT